MFNKIVDEFTENWNSQDNCPDLVKAWLAFLAYLTICKHVQYDIIIYVQ